MRVVSVKDYGLLKLTIIHLILMTSASVDTLLLQLGTPDCRLLWLKLSFGKIVDYVCRRITNNNNIRTNTTISYNETVFVFYANSYTHVGTLSVHVCCIGFVVSNFNTSIV